MHQDSEAAGDWVNTQPLMIVGAAYLLDGAGPRGADDLASFG